MVLILRYDTEFYSDGCMTTASKQIRGGVYAVPVEIDVELDAATIAHCTLISRSLTNTPLGRCKWVYFLLLLLLILILTTKFCSCSASKVSHERQDVHVSLNGCSFRCRLLEYLEVL